MSRKGDDQSVGHTTQPALLVGYNLTVHRVPDIQRNTLHDPRPPWFDLYGALASKKAVHTTNVTFSLSPDRGPIRGKTSSTLVAHTFYKGCAAAGAYHPAGFASARSGRQMRRRRPPMLQHKAKSGFVVCAKGWRRYGPSSKLLCTHSSWFPAVGCGEHAKCSDGPFTVSAASGGKQKCW